MKFLYLLVFLGCLLGAGYLVKSGESVLAIPMSACAGTFICLCLREQRTA